MFLSLKATKPPKEEVQKWVIPRVTELVGGDKTAIASPASARTCLLFIHRFYPPLINVPLTANKPIRLQTSLLPSLTATPRVSDVSEWRL